MSGWKIALKVPEACVPFWQEALEQHCSAVSAFEHDSRLWLLEGYSPEAPDRASLDLAVTLTATATSIDVPHVVVEKLPEWDWVVENQKNFPPIRLGRFYIYGSHIEIPPPVSSLPLLIDAATAFGTGEHPTTQGCLAALEMIHKRHPRISHVLDVGCGTGVLAMGAARLWPGIKGTGGDLHAPSVIVARDNARRNHMTGLHYVTASGTRHKQMQQHRPYPLIVANILAQPLCDLAPAITACLDRGGWLVLSGLLSWQKNQVCHAYRQQGLRLERVFLRDNWATLVFIKKH